LLFYFGIISVVIQQRDYVIIVDCQMDVSPFPDFLYVVLSSRKFIVGSPGAFKKVGESRQLKTFSVFKHIVFKV